MAFSNETILVDTGWIVDHRDDSSVCVVDTRKAKDYEQAHIANALSLPITSLIKHVGSTSSYPSKDEIEALFGSKGITNDLTLVAYDEHHGVYASRFLWTLEVFGHKNMGMLDRNFSVYAAEGKAVTAEASARPPATYVATLDPNKIATKGYILEKLKSGCGTIIDTRAGDEYTKGHIPRSINIPWTLGLGRERNFLEPDELKGVFAKFGIPGDEELITYCNQGMTASHAYFALKLAGHKKILLYPESFLEWGALPDSPKEYGTRRD
jgi:thiosulfate/3-mercaptopyruvate sulfurtransferase